MRQKSLNKIQNQDKNNKSSGKIVKPPRNKKVSKKKKTVNSEKDIYDRKRMLKMYKDFFNNRQPKDDEEWRDVVGYEGLYKVSNYGLVINRNYRIIGTYYRDYDNGFENKNYDCVSLTKDGKSTRYNIHRLVAIAFVENPNPDRFNVVNHIDEQIHNNYYKNLEWCDTLYNLNYGHAKEKRHNALKETNELKKMLTTIKTI